MKYMRAGLAKPPDDVVEVVDDVDDDLDIVRLLLGVRWLQDEFMETGKGEEGDDRSAIVSGEYQLSNSLALSGDEGTSYGLSTATVHQAKNRGPR